MGGLDGNGTPTKYIPYVKLDEYWADDVIEELLAIVGLVQDKTLIRQKYLRVFSILVVIGMVGYINEFTDRGLDDHIAAPLKQVSLLDDPAFNPVRQEYCDGQWMFCPAEFSHLYTKRFDNRRILPIAERKRFDGGNCDVAVMEKVRLNADCVRPWREVRPTTR